MSGQLHWWPAAASFGLGMMLTLALLLRPARIQMPAWVFADPTSGPGRKPAAKVSASDAPTQRIPVAGPRPVRKAAAKAPPKKRRPVSADAVTERIPIAANRPAKKLPAKKAAAKKVPGAKVPGKKLPPKKVRPKDPTRRVSVAKDVATEKIPVSDAATVETPLVPYAPYGPGSMRAEPDGSGPQGWLVKGRTDSRLFYGPDDPGYDELVAQVWFENEDFAKRAFFLPGRNSARKD